MRKLYFLIFLASFLLYSSPVFAATIFSPLLELEVEPGETQQGVVKVFNETEENLYLVSSVEPFTAGDETGQPVYLPIKEADKYLDWFEIEQESVVLQPHQVIVIPFSVTVPADAIPGGYYAVVFWESSSDELSGTSPVGITSKVGTLIFLKIKGEIDEAGEVAEFSLEDKKKFFFNWPINFVTRFFNTGNIHLRPTGTIELKNILGQVKRLEVNAAKRYVLPESIRRFEVVWGQKIPDGNVWQKFWSGLKQELSSAAFGPYTATLNLNYGVTNPDTATKQLRFWFIPMRLIIFVIALAIFLIALIKINSKINKIKKLKATPRPKLNQKKKLTNGKQE